MGEMAMEIQKRMRKYDAPSFDGYVRERGRVCVVYDSAMRVLLSWAVLFHAMLCVCSRNGIESERSNNIGT